MGTIEIHEPEVKKEVKPASRPGPAAVLPNSDLLGGRQLAPRMMFSDSLLEFGEQRKRKVLCHDHLLHFELRGHRRDAGHAVGVHRGTAEGAVADVPGGAASAAPAAPSGRRSRCRRVVRQIQTDMLNTGQLRTPTKIPQKIRDD